jgi:hypothetical protein
LVLGEILAPAVLLTLAQWFLAGLVTILMGSGAPFGGVAPDKRLGWALATAILCPPLNLISLVLTNGATLLLPAWARVGPGASQGFEAMGHQMLFMIGQLLALALALIAPAVVASVVFFLGRGWLPILFLAPLGAAAAAAILLLEVFLGLRMLGDLFERMDISEELMGQG